MGWYQVIFHWDKNDAPEGGPDIAPDVGKVLELTKALRQEAAQERRQSSEGVKFGGEK